MVESYSECVMMQFLPQWNWSIVWVFGMEMDTEIRHKSQKQESLEFSVPSLPPSERKGETYRLCESESEGPRSRNVKNFLESVLDT